MAKGSVWYLVADTEKGMRTFRVWRVQEAELLDDPVVEPPGFDLADHWRDVVDQMDERRTERTVRLLADAESVPWLRGHFANRVLVGEQQDDGRVLLEIGFPTDETWRPAMELSGYADVVEVLDPPDVLEHLAQIGARLQQRYA
ncbi:hypothetical protein B7486_68385 [cyanobacterium TDX16]|nr:hypothetical protein B7486_68385 [cyanobacterium TDX16]